MGDVDFYERELFFETQRQKKLKKIISGKAGKVERGIFNFFNSKSMGELKQELSGLSPRIADLKQQIKKAQKKQDQEMKRQKSRDTYNDATASFSTTQGAITGNFINLDGNPFTPF